jgi:hypothetical protein
MPPASRRPITAYITGDIKGLQRAAKQARSTIAGIGKGFAGLVVGGATFAGVRELDQLADAAIKAGDEIGKAAKTAGIGAKALQEYRYAAEKGGQSQKQLDDAVARYNRRLGEARNGNKAYAETFRRMGVDITDTNEQALAKTFEFLADVKDEATRASYATKVFGDDARRMALLVEGGAAALEKNRREANELGIVLEQGVVSAAEKAKDQLTLNQRQLDNELYTAVLKNVDGLVQLKTAWNEVAIAAVKAGGAFGNALRGNEGLTDRELEDRIAAARRRVETSRRSRSGNTLGQPGLALEALLAEQRRRNQARIVSLDDIQAGLGESKITPPGDGFSFSGNVPGVPSLKKDALFKASEKALDRIAEITERAATPMEKLKNELAEIQDLKPFAETPEQVALLNRAAIGLEKEMQALRDSTNGWKQASEDASQSLADGFARAAIYGDNLSDVLDNIIKRLAFNGLSNLISSFLPGGNGGAGGFLSRIFGGPRAAGGPVIPGKAYLVGERGPELFAPSTAGQILPNGEGMGGVTVHVTNRFDVGLESVDQRIQAVTPQITGAIVGAVERARRRPGYA